MKALGKRSVASFLTVLLNVAWYVVAFALALTLCLVIASPFIDVSTMTLTIPVSFSLEPRAHLVTAPSLGIGEAQNSGIRLGGEPGFGFEIDDTDKEPRAQVRGSVRFPTSSRALFGGNAAILGAFLALVLWALGQLRAVFRTLRDGHPFVPANATRIRRIALAVIVIELGRTTAVFFENYYAMTRFSAEGLRFEATPDFDVFAIVNGLIILVIAEVFRAGARLDEEQSLTI
jgi:hypothetical protein